MTSELKKLISLDFEARIVASTPSVLRLLLLRAKEVSELRRIYDEGGVSSADIRAFVDELLRKHAMESVFPHQIALAAIAVMLESRFTPLADEYLECLSRLNNERFLQASRVARICLAQRSVQAQHEVTWFDFPELLLPLELFDEWFVSVVEPTSSSRQRSNFRVTSKKFDFSHAQT